MIIGVCGFGSTGSSAVSDFLIEYGDSLQVLDDIEFTWVSAPDSLIDLEYHLFNPHNRTSDSIVAIRRYKEYSERNTGLLLSVGATKNNIDKSTQEFLESITAVKWNWYDFSKKYSSLYNRIFNHLIYVTLPRMEIKKGHQINCKLMDEVSLSVFPENFYEAARKHINELLQEIGAKFDKPLVLDQPFSGNNPQACFSFFDDPYAIVVDRDPRDNYVFAKTKLLGRNHFMAVEPVEDFIKYYRVIRENQPYKNKNSRVL